HNCRSLHRLRLRGDFIYEQWLLAQRAEQLLSLGLAAHLDHEGGDVAVHVVAKQHHILSVFVRILLCHRCSSDFAIMSTARWRFWSYSISMTDHVRFGPSITTSSPPHPAWTLCIVVSALIISLTVTTPPRHLSLSHTWHTEWPYRSSLAW